MAAVTICSCFGGPQNSLSLFHLVPHLLAWSDGTDAMILVFWILSLKPGFHSPLSPSSRGSSVPFRCHKDDVICLSEVIDIFPGNLDSSLCFFQSSVSHDVLCIWVMFNSLWPNGLQHIRISCPSTTPELAQIHVHQVMDIQPSHLLLSPSPPAFNLSQHQDLFQGVSSSHSDGQSIGVSASASVLPVNIWFDFL